MVGPLDEYPIHQLPLPVAWAGPSDRNFYDRCYLNAHDRTGEVFLVTGLGVYPNLGVIDAFACVRRGDLQHSVRMTWGDSSTAGYEPRQRRSKPTPWSAASQINRSSSSGFTTSMR